MLCAFVATADAKPGKKPASPAGIADKQADLVELRDRIDTLRHDLAASEGHKTEAADSLRESERRISGLQRDLHTLAAQRGELQSTLQNLGRQSAELESKLAQQQAQLGKLLSRQYQQGMPDTLRLVLNGGDPNQLARDVHYLSAIARARADLLGEIRGNLDQQKALSADTQARSDELAGVEASQKQQHAQLAQQREERRAVLAKISEHINSQRKEIGTLQENEKRLSQLIDRLAKILAAQAAKPRPKPRPPPAESGTSKPRDKATEPADRKPVEIVENRLDPEPATGQFAKLKGRLRLPSKGTVTGRFGSAREGGGTWKGLYIRAGAGSDVKAVANGQVVFAEWMRGFGNLLIIDHGDAYLSIYGNNESLLKQVGETVKGGETVATVGNSGGNPESGLYFEIRHQGQAIDPLKWASLK